MSDLKILKELIQAKATEPLREEYQQYNVTLKETEGKKYSVIIKNLPKNSIVIKAEKFKPPSSIFQSTKGECSRADYAIITQKDNKKWIIFIEMKETKFNGVTRQLKGALCFILYCKEIGKVFWEKENFLEGYKHRFIGITKINSNKQPTRNPTFKTHYKPEDFRKIKCAEHLHFKELV